MKRLKSSRNIKSRVALIFNLCLSVFFAFLFSCNHVFYHPDSKVYLTPDKVGLDYKEFSIESADGLKLHAWLIPAKTPAKATILHFHGNAENISSHFMFFAWLVDYGFNIVAFDYRGYGQSEGNPDRDGLVKDGVAVISWLRQQEFPGASSIIVAAQSLGGAVAVPALKESGREKIKAIILDSTFSSYRHIAREKLASFWLTWPLQWPLSFLVSDELSPIDSIRAVSVPLLFVHGKGDGIVPYVLGRKLFEEASEPKEFWDVPWGGHTSAFMVEDDKLRKKLVKYLSEQIQ